MTFLMFLTFFTIANSSFLQSCAPSLSKCCLELCSTSMCFPLFFHGSQFDNHTLHLLDQFPEKAPPPHGTTSCLFLFYKGKNISPHHENSHYKSLPFLSNLFKLFKNQNIQDNIFYCKLGLY